MIEAEETVYVDQMYEVSSASDNPVATINVYLGETRLVSKLANLNDPNATTESRNTFFLDRSKKLFYRFVRVMGGEPVKTIFSCMCALCALSLSCQNITFDKDLTNDEALAIIPKLEKLYEIRFSQSKLVIFGTRIKEGQFKDQKLLTVYDGSDNLVQNKVIYLPDTDTLFSFDMRNEKCCFKLKYMETPTSRFVFYDAVKRKISSYPITDYWVANSVVGNGSILYSTEFADNTIKRIDLETGYVQTYDGYFPNVDLFEGNGEKVLAVFFYENQWHEILATDIRVSEIKYPHGNKKKIS